VIIVPIDYSKPIKLDIGSGFNPTPGYIHLDIRRDLPDLDIVCDFSKQPLPFSCGVVDEIISNHSIEHIKWTEVSFMVKEWVRVLRPGGIAKIRTPDLFMIVKNYMAGVKTKEWPDDEKRAREIFGQCEAAEIALIKLFAGQDYDSNVHYACYDFQMLSSLLKRCGFSQVESSRFGPEFSPHELQVIATKESLIPIQS